MPAVRFEPVGHRHVKLPTISSIHQLSISIILWAVKSKTTRTNFSLFPVTPPTVVDTFLHVLYIKLFPRFLVTSFLSHRLQ